MTKCRWLALSASLWFSAGLSTACGISASVEAQTTNASSSSGATAASGASSSSGASGSGGALSSDVSAPTIPTGLVVASSALDSSNQAAVTLTFDFPQDPVLADAVHTGVGQFNIERDGKPYATVTASAPGFATALTAGDVGDVGATGSSVQAADGTDFTVSGAGADIYGTADAFQFDAVPFNGDGTGDGTIVAELTSLGTDSANPKAGIMFRQSLAASDAFVMIGFQNGNAVVQVRTASGASASSVSYVGGATLPLWLKLNRTGNVFTAFTSTDGNAWTRQAQTTVDMTAAAYVGLAVTSQVAGTLVQADFAQAAISSQGPVTFTDKNVPASTTHTYAVSAQDLASPANVSKVGPAVSVTTPSVVNQSSLLGYLQGLETASGKHALIGQHSSYWDSNSLDYEQALVQQTGKTPAILGTTSQMVGSTQADPSYTNAWLAQGGIVMVSYWPEDPFTNAFDNDRSITFSDLLDSTTQAYQTWHQYLAAQVAFFKAVNGTVLYRPLLEMNGNWSWWDGQDAATFVQVWQQMHAYFASQGVTNVLWVWAPNYGGTSFSSYYPGSDYVDVVGVDYYGTNPAEMASDGNPSSYQTYLGFGKPFIFAECGAASAPNAPMPHTADSSIFTTAMQNTLTQMVAAVFWCQSWALTEQNNASEVMDSPVSLTLSDLPSGL